MTTTTILGVVSVVAVVAGPLITLSIQRWLEDRREKRQARLWVFRTLMMYRATPLAPLYVQALNLIDVVFNAESKKEKAVRTGWKVLLNHLDKDKGRPDFGEQSQTLTANLLAAMGACLGYDFDEVYLKQHAYRGHYTKRQKSYGKGFRVSADLRRFYTQRNACPPGKKVFPNNRPAYSDGHLVAGAADSSASGPPWNSARNDSIVASVPVWDH